MVASLPCLLQLLCQKRFLRCKLGNEKANGTDLLADERMETQKDHAHRGAEHNRKGGLEVVSAKTPQGNEPFGC